MELIVGVYSTYITVPSDKYGWITRDVNMQALLETLQELEWVEWKRRYEVKVRYYLHNQQTNQMHLPRHVLATVESLLKANRITYTVKPFPAVKASALGDITMRPEWVDRVEHKAALEFLLNKTETMRVNNMQQGKGKSYLGVKCCTILKQKALIVCSGVCDQWKRNILEKTTATDDDVFILQSASSVVKLYALKVVPSFIVASIETLRNYIACQIPPYTEVPSYTDMLERFGIGIKIVDEIHLNSHAYVMVDMRSNVEHNFYLSATPERSGTIAQQIFSVVFPDAIIGGNSKYDKYVHGGIYKYYLPFYRPIRCTTNRGYSHIVYEQVLLQDGQMLQTYKNMILSVVRSDYYNCKHPEGKLLVFVSTIEMAKRLQSYIAYEFKDLDVRTYTSADPIDNLYDADVIVGTPKSCGTAKDIPHLQTAINTVSLKSKPLVEQMLGRLRKLDGYTVRFTDLSNRCMFQHAFHLKERRGIFRDKCVTLQEIDI